MTKQNESLWIHTTTPVDSDVFRNGLHVDVAVIGGGITGLTAAMLLKTRGKRVALIEKGRVAGGETGQTTAHLTEAVDARYHALARDFSKETAAKVARASRAAIEQIASFIDEYRIDCEFQRVPGYLYTEKRDKVAELKREAVAAAQAGVTARFVEDVPLPFPTRGAVLFENQAQFHPLRYAKGLAARIRGDGSFIFEGTNVTSVTTGTPCALETTKGRLTADAVLMATNVPIEGFLTPLPKDAAYRTYALAFEGSAHHPVGLFWDTADPYHYTRWHQTGAETFLIVGGEDRRVGDEEDSEACFSRLLQYSVEHFGALPLRHRWSGLIIEPADGLPFIGGSGPLYVSTGYSGQGMTFGTVGAMIVADLISGRGNEWAELFDPKRVHDGPAREPLERVDPSGE